MNYTYPLIFWFIIQLFSLIGLPIIFTLLKHLPDKGYTFAKPVGLLLSGYLLWLGASFGLIRNHLGGTIFAMLVIAGLGWSWVWPQREALFSWLKANRVYVVTVEAIFGLAFIAWTIYKAYNPDITTAGGEKWMEIAFINATLLSPTFPPQDPWLSGFGISYYYFGYVLMAMLIRLSGIVASTAFNLLIPLLFSLTLIGAFGLATNLVCLHQQAQSPNRLAIGFGGLGALFVAIMGHWEGVLEVLHSRGLLSPAFWQWLDIRDLNVPPQADGDGPWIPTRFIWWWRGSRVLTDYDLAGREQEVIDEIPFFSFLLGDVHPHVLTLPFVLLALAIALNLLLNRREADLSTSPSLLTNLGQSVTDLVSALGGRAGFFISVICVGALGFLNTWDLPIYLAVLGLAYWLWRARENVLEPVFSMGVFATCCLLLYLPFYLTFQSQANGILPNWWNPTHLPQFIVFFGPFLISSIAFMIFISSKRQAGWSHTLWSFPLILFLPVIFWGLLTLILSRLPAGETYLQGILNDPAVQTIIGGSTQDDLWPVVIQLRLSKPWTFLLLGCLLAWVTAFWWTGLTTTKPLDRLDQAEKFGLTLLIVGLLLPLSLEFVFLRDLFNIRMNTVFKFYFQAWVLLAVASAFGVYYVYQKLPSTGRLIWSSLMTVAVLMGMVYPVLATLNKTNNFTGQPTLDGIAWVANYEPNDHAAVLWLKQNTPPDALVLEASGSSYRYDNRVSALTGRATLLGWGWHEHQWRGTFEVSGIRERDINTLFNSTDLTETRDLLMKYDIDYVYIGSIERNRYSPAGLAKFDRLLDVAFTEGNVVIYEGP